MKSFLLGETRFFGRLRKKRDKGKMLSDKGVENGGPCSVVVFVGPLRLIKIDSGGEKEAGEEQGRSDQGRNRRSHHVWQAYLLARYQEYQYEKRP